MTEGTSGRRFYGSKNRVRRWRFLRLFSLVRVGKGASYATPVSLLLLGLETERETQPPPGAKARDPQSATLLGFLC